MRINAHTHIFNLKSVFTEETMDIMLRRVTDFEIPDFIKTEVRDLLIDAISKAGDNLEIEARVEDFVKKVAISEKLKEFGEGEKIRFELIGGDLVEKAGVELLANLLKRVTKLVDSAREDARDQQSFVDLLDFIIIGLKPSIAAVTSHIMNQLSRNDIIVALMMDITGGRERDGKFFEQQMKKTADQVLRYPGRILPFIAVNPLRSNHRSIMERALTSRGFVGVKLYPSLGYSIDSEEMDEVYSYCHRRGIPILMHCTNAGFYAGDEFRKNSEPELWEPILKKYQGLKLCFGHFGGSENLCEAWISSESWTGQIIELMKVPENTGVYTDISFHSEPMKGGERERHYFKNMKDLLADPVLGERLMFGTDFWLARMALAEKSQWQYFETTLNDQDLFTKLVRTNPARFLGIGEAPGQSGENIRNYVQFLIDSRSLLNPGAAADWIIEEVKAAGDTEIDWTSPQPAAFWSANNEAHVRTYWYLRDNQMYPDEAETADFFQCAYFPITSLQYWNKEFEAASIFSRKCEAVARGLDRYFRTNGARYERTGEDARDRAIQAMINALADEGTAFADLGSLCDGLYQFLTEAESVTPE